MTLTPTIETFSFGGGRGTTDRSIPLAATPKLSPGATVVAELAGDLETEGGGDSFPVEGVTLAPTVTQFGDVRLFVCLDPQQPESVERGRYLGTVQVGGPGIETGTATLEVQLRAAPALAIVTAVIGLLIGLLLKMLADLNKDPKAKVSVAWIKDYVGRGAFAVGLLFGLVAVAASYFQLYDNSPIWGSGEDIFKIFIAGVTLQITGTTAVDFFKPFTSVDENPPEKP